MTDDTATPLDGVTTFTGETLMGALTALDSALPKGAYKAVSLGGRTFTDISPAYSLEVISEHFGPLGLGWGYVIEDEHTHDHKTADKQQNDGTVRHGQHYLGVTLRIRLWFETRGTREGIVEWQSYGGNANAGSGADEHFSWQGALTNAIGKGWSMQGFQRRIYKGEDFTFDEKREADASAAPNPSAAPSAPQAAKSTDAPTVATKAVEANFRAMGAACKENGTRSNVEKAWKAMGVSVAHQTRDGFAALTVEQRALLEGIANEKPEAAPVPGDDSEDIPF